MLQPQQFSLSANLFDELMPYSFEETMDHPNIFKYPQHHNIKTDQ